jgi:serine carboxypeptidase-like clade I
MQWFQLYPEFLENPFYIAGESYAGVYVPTLSHEVVEGAAFRTLINHRSLSSG